MFTSCKKLSGPIMFAQNTSKGLYFSGEYHNINGPINGPHIVQYVLEYAKKHPTEKITIIMEGNAKDLRIYANQSTEQPSPIKVLASHIIIERGTHIPSNINILLADVRRDRFFCIFESIYDFESFASIWIVEDEQYASNYYKQFKLSKTFEMDFFKEAMTSRIKCVEFMMSLIDPFIPYQPWFKVYLDKMNPTGVPNRVKEAINKMYATKDRAIFVSHLRGILKTMIINAISSNNNFSPAMARVQKTQRIGSKQFVADKYKYFQAFMIALTSIFMDIHTIGMMLEESQTKDHVLLMAGVNHIMNIVQYLSPSGMEFTYNSLGNLDFTNMQSKLPTTRQFAKSPHSLLRNFLVEEKKK